MSQGIEKLYTIFSVLFYIGILFVIYLYTIDNNAAVWIIAETMVVVGIYVMISTDVLQKKKTSLFTIDFFESDRKQNEGYGETMK